MLKREMVCGGIILILFGNFLNIILHFIFKVLKKDYLFIVTSFAIFLTILSSFSIVLSPKPPIASIIILLYLSEILDSDLLHSGYFSRN
jgi:hypothetical protein